MNDMIPTFRRLARNMLLDIEATTYDGSDR